MISCLFYYYLLSFIRFIFLNLTYSRCSGGFFEGNQPFIEFFPNGVDPKINSIILVTTTVAALGILFFIFKYFLVKKSIDFFINKNDSSEKKTPSDTRGTSEIPAEGENPEWDVFLAEVLHALGLTLAEVSGALLYEIWRAYQTLVQSGNAAAAAEIIKLALEQLGLLLPYTLPLFILIAALVFMLRMVYYQIKEEKIKEDEEKKRSKKNDEILKKLDKVLESEGYKNYLKSWSFYLKKIFENWIKKP